MEARRKGEIALLYMKYIARTSAFCKEKNWDRKNFMKIVRKVARNRDIEAQSVKKFFNALIEGTAEKSFVETQLHKIAYGIAPEFLGYNGEFVISREIRTSISEEAHILSLDLNEYLEFNREIYISLVNEILKPIEKIS